MKNLLLSFSLTLLCSLMNAQQQIDPRIQELYGNKTEEIVGRDPQLLNFLTVLLNERIKIMEVESNKIDNSFPKLSQVKLMNKYNSAITRDEVFNSETFNPLKYNFEISSNSETKIYHVDNTNYLIVIEPQSKTTNH